MKTKTQTQYLAQVQFAYKKDDNWYNAKRLSNKYSLNGGRYFDSVTDAKRCLKELIEQNNKEIARKSKTDYVGGLGISYDVTDDDKIIAYRIKTREVTEWQEIEFELD